MGDAPDAWTQVDVDELGWQLAPLTKHGGVIGLTKAQHDQIRLANIADIPEPDLGTAQVTEGDDIELPASVPASLHDGRTVNSAVTWQEPVTTEDSEGRTVLSYTGSVNALGNNLNHSTSNDHEVAELVSTTALPTVQFEVVVVPVDDGTDPDEPGNGDDDDDNGDPGVDEPGTGDDDDASSGNDSDGLATTGASALPLVIGLLLVAGGLALRTTRRAQH